MVKSETALRGHALTHRTVVVLSAAFVLAAFSHPAARSQALPTATQAIQLSAFGGVSGVYTGLGDGRNLSITAGANLGLRPLFSFYPSITIRGTYPLKSGTVDGLETGLAGLQMQKRFGRFHPYFNILFGRGQINYVKLYPDQSGFYYYSASTSNVLSPGGGVDIDVMGPFALKADVQYQHYASPVTVSGSQFATPITIGAVYRFDFNRHGPSTK